MKEDLVNNSLSNRKSCEHIALTLAERTGIIRGIELVLELNEEDL